MFNLAMRSIFRKKKEPLFGNRFDTMFKKNGANGPVFFMATDSVAPIVCSATIFASI